MDHPFLYYPWVFPPNPNFVTGVLALLRGDHGIYTRGLSYTVSKFSSESEFLRQNLTSSQWLFLLTFPKKYFYNIG